MAQAQGVTFQFDTQIERLIEEGGRVRGVRTNQGQVMGDGVLVALGAWSPFLLRAIPLPSPSRMRRARRSQPFWMKHSKWR